MLLKLIDDHFFLFEDKQPNLMEWCLDNNGNLRHVDAFDSKFMALDVTTNPEDAFGDNSCFLIHGCMRLKASNNALIKSKVISTKNCREITSIFDVRDLAYQYDDLFPYDVQTKHLVEIFEAGFHKCLDIRKDYRFTLQDMKDAIDFGLNNGNDSLKEYEAKKQQFLAEKMKKKTEWKVEIKEETENYIFIKNPTL